MKSYTTIPSNTTNRLAVHPLDSLPSKLRDLVFRLIAGAPSKCGHGSWESYALAKQRIEVACGGDFKLRDRAVAAYLEGVKL